MEVVALILGWISDTWSNFQHWSQQPATNGIILAGFMWLAIVGAGTARSLAAAIDTVQRQVNRLLGW